ncbi:MAG: hypothetical protein A2571_00420 [Candidatus Vogelbacteria bacterium RIFOXYD1_FULL_44_32]|uniref:Uncharacterized protein n=1 Tax=Candidatus Vogelbacteria bacterium RIFOXYD1_FULL_44_32 TaxID=1802438 RepID=A0A1G2QE25_9BACT|nr:MAG: hypothetical protein A2571_00420 [Candidatus Vogelbacteria bacterium RIFOXYD1_FULL_44_32]
MNYPSSFKQASLILVSVAFVFLVAGVAYAEWANPACGPTGCNTPTPINVGSTTQTKAGGFNLRQASILELGKEFPTTIKEEKAGRIFYFNNGVVSTDSKPGISVRIFGGGNAVGNRMVHLLDNLFVGGTINAFKYNICTTSAEGAVVCSPFTGGGDGLWTLNSTGTAISPSVLTRRVGIGTTTPDYKLTVDGIISATGLLMSRNHSPSLVLFDTDNSSVNARIQVQNNLLSFNRVSSSNNIAATPLSINLNSGNVGVGTVVDPTLFKLQVYGSVGPHLDNRYDLGSPTRRWANLYASNIYKCSGPDEDLCTEVTNNNGGDKWASSTANVNNIYNKNLTGNVGVGTANPQTKFHVKTGIVNILFSNGGADGTDAIIAATKDGGSSAPLTFLSNRYKFGADGEMLMIASNGNVGIGNPAPTSKLQVNGATRIDGALAAFGTLFSSGQIIGENAAPSILLNQTGETDKNARIQMDGSLLTFRKVGSPSVTYPNGNNTLATPLVVDFNTGKVGIGTNSPSTNLHVTGTIGVDGTSFSAAELGRLKFGAFNLEGKDVGYIRYKNTSPQSLDVYGGVVVAEGVPMQPRLIRLFDDVNIAGKLTVNRICSTTGICFDTSSVGGQWATSGNNIYNTNTGKVGIGTNVPGTKLDIDNGTTNYTVGLTARTVSDLTGTSNFPVAIIANNTNSANSGVGLRFAAKNGNAANNATLAQISGVIERASTGAVNYGGLQFTVTDGAHLVDAMRISREGKVGIGTNDPSNKLDVEGGITANNVRIDRGGSISLGTADIDSNTKLDVDGKVRLRSLAADNVSTRVLVADNDGKIGYKDTATSGEGQKMCTAIGVGGAFYNFKLKISSFLLSMLDRYAEARNNSRVYIPANNVPPNDKRICLGNACVTVFQAGGILPAGSLMDRYILPDIGANMRASLDEAFNSLPRVVESNIPVPSSWTIRDCQQYVAAQTGAIESYQVGCIFKEAQGDGKRFSYSNVGVVWSKSALGGGAGLVIGGRVGGDVVSALIGGAIGNTAGNGSLEVNNVSRPTYNCGW